MIAQNFRNEVLQTKVENLFSKQILIKIVKNVIFWTKNGGKWQSQKNLVEKFFLVGIDSEGFKTYSKPKNLEDKFFPVTVFFLELSFFGQNSQK